MVVCAPRMMFVKQYGYSVDELAQGVVSTDHTECSRSGGANQIWHQEAVPHPLAPSA